MSKKIRSRTREAKKQRPMTASILIVAACAGMLAALSACGNPMTEGRASVDGMGTSAYRVGSVNGTPVWNVVCGGLLSDISICYQRARNICQGDFNLINQEQATLGGFASIGTSGGFAALQGRVPPSGVGAVGK
jgi:hypothetical protein